MISVRAFNNSGIEKFEEWLGYIYDGWNRPKPVQIMASDEFSTVVGGFKDLDDTLNFETLWELSVHLQEIAPANLNELDNETIDGVCAWLSFVYFDKLHKKRTQGHKGGGWINHKPEFFIHKSDDYRLKYRCKTHLALTLPKDKRCAEGFAEWILKVQQADSYGDLLESILAYDLFRSYAHPQRFLMKAYKQGEGGYVPNTSQNPEKGKVENCKGNLRRFNVTLRRLQDIGAVELMTPEDFAEIWGDEFKDSKFAF